LDDAWQGGVLEIRVAVRLRTCEVDVGCSVLGILCILEVKEDAINVFLLPKI
jgi:hypothetical protein